MLRRTAFALVLAAAVVCATVSAQRGSPQTALGQARLPVDVMADGHALGAGSYQVRLGADEPPHGAGQTAGAERWVEFVRDGQVAGRELATVISAADMPSIAKSPRPADNSVRVDRLAGGPYLRVWINHNGVNYLINLRTAR